MTPYDNVISNLNHSEYKAKQNPNNYHKRIHTHTHTHKNSRKYRRIEELTVSESSLTDGTREPSPDKSCRSRDGKLDLMDVISPPNCLLSHYCFFEQKEKKRRKKKSKKTSKNIIRKALKAEAKSGIELNHTK